VFSDRSVALGRAGKLAVFLGLVIRTAAGSGVAGEPAPAVAGATVDWAGTMLAARARLASSGLSGVARDREAARLWSEMETGFPVPWDWVMQDHGPAFPSWFNADSAAIERAMIIRVLGELGDRAGDLHAVLDKLDRSAAGPSSPGWLRLYVRACERRREARLTIVREKAPRVVFTRHSTVRPSFFAYTEGQSDAQNERHFLPGSTLCLLDQDGLYGRVRTLIDDPTGAIRDPAVSFDGRRVVFAWKKALDDDDYHLYELDLASGGVRPLTSGLGVADYEPAFLPDGGLIFSSSRCVQTVDCWWTEVSNLYRCDADGRHIRRLVFDQVHSIFPAVLDDGRVIYSRWDYNDRGQIFPQSLFQMNPDGTGQTEFYKNNSWFPTTIVHARGLPGTQQVLAVFCGHHTTQAGKLGVLDPSKGRQDNAGAQLVAPVRETKAERIDVYGQQGELFQYPYPLSETAFLVAYATLGWDNQGRNGRRKGDAHFGIYWMNMNGDRELLASDPKLPCQQPVPLATRVRPPVRPSPVDYRKTTGTCYVQDVYAGPGLTGVPRGTVKRLRVVKLEFRPAGIGNNGSSGPGGAALVCTPIAIGNGSWDVKVVLGDARVFDDGSAFFTVPARTPIYFQAIDDRGHAIQTMRSWTTLQPGENAACVGCHEHKNSTPLPRAGGPALALEVGPQALEPFYGPPRGFSFPKEIQPILDRHCISCHNDRDARMPADRLVNAQINRRDPDWSLSPAPPEVLLLDEKSQAKRPRDARPAFSLLGAANLDRTAKRAWSDAYMNLTLAYPDRDDWARGALRGWVDGRVVNWIGSQSIPAPIPPYAAGSTRSALIGLLQRGHHGVTLGREELEKLSCWIDLYVPYCGDYTEASTWSDQEMEKYRRYESKRKRLADDERRDLAESRSGHTRPTP
jgi:Hydrazine synthase alpha subunit middle domain